MFRKKNLLSVIKR
ncbi:uncharacterized protein FFM5_14728 [Fusarium fujikuroi]|nr:uncharacterized protein FFM5_14728 [Fusarium fujikuroi]